MERPPGSRSPHIHFCSPRHNPALLHAVYAFRARVLVEQEGWRLEVEDGLERDEFDTDDAIHAVLISDGNIRACMRFIRANRPYLARLKFPQLAIYRPYPTHAFAWELSRLAVDETARADGTMLHAYALAFHFLRAMGGVSLVAFAEVAKERLVRRIGITTHLLGPPTEIGTDVGGRPMIVVAGELPLRLQRGPRFDALMSLSDTTEIADAFAVFGRSRLSA